MKVIIAGSRDFNNYEYMKQMLDQQIYELAEELNLLDEVVEIVSGRARGADKLGEKYSKDRDYGLKIFPADWKRYGKRAGYLRNEQMAQYADVCICFWDGESRGTKHMIDLANRYGLKVIVNNYKENNDDNDIDFI